MTNCRTFSTDIWKIRLPEDWSEQGRSARHAAYFESADGKKGAYMAAWCFPDDPRTVREILDSIHSIECRTLQETEDSAWVSMGEWSEDTHDVNSIVEVFYDRRKHYQIVCYLTARLPWVVRSTFHDYDCTDHDRSKLFFKPIIESLQFHDADA